MSDQVQITAIATVIAAIIAAFAAIATQRSAAAAAVRNQTVSSRTDIEKEAFERAKNFYTDTIDRQDGQIHELESDIANVRGRLKAVEEELATERALSQSERDRAQRLQARIEALQKQLDLAQQTLRLRYPDE